MFFLHAYSAFIEIKRFYAGLFLVDFKLTIKLNRKSLPPRSTTRNCDPDLNTSKFAPLSVTLFATSTYLQNTAAASGSSTRVRSSWFMPAWSKKYIVFKSVVCFKINLEITQMYDITINKCRLLLLRFHKYIYKNIHQLDQKNDF